MKIPSLAPLESIQKKEKMEVCKGKRSKGRNERLKEMDTVKKLNLYSEPVVLRLDGT